MLKNIFIVFSLLVGLVSCSVENVAEQEQNKNDTDIQNYIKQNKLTMQKTTDGMYYSIKSTATTKSASNSDLVKLNYKLTLLDGTFVDSTNSSLSQFKYIIFGVSQSLFNPIVQIMKEGEKGTFLLPSGLAFGANTFGSVPAYSVIKAEVEVVSIRNQVEQIADMQKIYSFDKAETTKSGLIFQKTLEVSTGDAITIGKLVQVKYTGRLGYGYIQVDAANKVIYDSKFGTGTFNVNVGAGQVIPGFEEMLLKLKVGEKGKAILPYSIAYGTAGNSTIPGYSPLYFEIEVVSAL